MILLNKLDRHRHREIKKSIILQMASLTSNDELVLQDDLDAPSKDLLARLLVVDPQKRLHSLRALGTIAFFKGYNFEDVKGKKVSMVQFFLWLRHHVLTNSSFKRLSFRSFV